MQKQINIIYNFDISISPGKMKSRETSIERQKIEDVVVIFGLIVVQFLYAGNSILLSYLLKLGFHPSSLIIFSTFATFVVLSPFSIFFERSQWPKIVGFKLFIQLVLLAFGGVTMFQYLFMKGVNLTSPAMATAMPNLAPGLIFFIAWAFRLEKIELGCKYSRAKIAGTLLCVAGAITMSLLQSTTVELNRHRTNNDSLQLGETLFDKQTIVGCIYLIFAVLVMSSQVVLQAVTLRDFPAPMSLCAVTSLIGVLITTLVQFMMEGPKWDKGWNLFTIQELIAFSILSGIVSGVCISFNAWAMKKRGPVMVSIFNPLATVISVIFSVISLRQSISIRSLAGMGMMFTGLYFVLWAKGKEGFPPTDDESQYDVEKPLLS